MFTSPGQAQCVTNDRPPSQVETNQQFIDDAIRRMDETANNLVSRLQPVLMPNSPVEGKKDPKLTEMLVPVAQRSNSQAQSIQRINELLTDALVRLAL